MDKSTTKSTLAKYLIPLDVNAMMQEIDSFGLDKYTKKLDTITFAKLFVFARVKQIGSLTDISAELNKNESLQVELDLESISTLQLSRKLQEISTLKFSNPSFTDVFNKLAASAGPRKQLSNWVEFISSTFPLFPSFTCACRSTVGLSSAKPKLVSSFLGRVAEQGRQIERVGIPPGKV